MIPILYESTETMFTNNGLCRLRDAISVKVTEERNSVYECDFDYPVDGANFDMIRCGRIIGVEHDDTNDIQPFDIVSYEKPIDGVVSFHAVHVSYRLSKMCVIGIDVTSLEEAFQLLGEFAVPPSSGFNYWTDKTSTGAVSALDGTPRTVREVLGGTEGSILDAYGGEYEWDKFTVKLWGSRGEEKSYTIRYGLNMVDYNEELDYSETYSGVYPYWTNGEEKVVGSVSWTSKNPYNGRAEIVPLDMSEMFEEKPSAQDLDNAAQGLSSTLPHQNIEVSFIRIQDTAEYARYANLQRCKLCDTVKVEFPKYNMSGSFKIVRTVYDVLLERFESMELGSLRTTLSEALGVGTSVSYSYSGGGGGGGSGVTSYEDLTDKPQIEGVTLSGNKTYAQLNLARLSNTDIQTIVEQ